VTTTAATETSKAGVGTSFRPLNQIDAGLLNVGIIPYLRGFGTTQAVTDVIKTAAAPVDPPAVAAGG
jgi:hypothetical protein